MRAKRNKEITAAISAALLAAIFFTVPFPFNTRRESWAAHSIQRSFSILRENEAERHPQMSNGAAHSARDVRKPFARLSARGATRFWCLPAKQCNDPLGWSGISISSSAAIDEPCCWL